MALARPYVAPRARTVRVLDRNDSHRFWIQATSVSPWLDADHCKVCTSRSCRFFQSFFIIYEISGKDRRNNPAADDEDFCACCA
jgi:hypothetical protein